MPATWLLEANYNPRQMFKITHLDLRQAGTLNPLVLDYLERSKQLKPYYSIFPDKDGFAELLKTNPYSGFDRDTLVTTLLQQSQRVTNTSPETIANINLLKDGHTFTVTTGHQLCLFTGPLYFIYKIFSVINLARDLKKQFPGKEFVPVYWMASEDHDFEEVASFHTNGSTLTWKSDQKGAVGSFNTRELKALVPELAAALGLSENSKYLVDLFETAYLKHDTLAKATHYLVNALFGQYGLISLDGDDAVFKQQFRPFFSKDIFENAAYAQVTKTNAELETMGYSIQVSPRPINCFYLDDQLRVRIEEKDGLFHLVGTDRSFTKEQLQDIVDHQPERISPNVVLRPLYQQVILPNISYTGGPGELAYWLEFKAMFDQAGVFFPVLMPRNFLTIVDAATRRPIEKLNFSEADLFKPEQDLVKDHLVKTNSVFALDKEIQQLENLYEQIAGRTTKVDVTLERHVLAARQRALNQLKVVSQKTNRALKKSEETSIRQIESMKQGLFPKGVPQERFDNFAGYYLKYGPDFFKAIETAIDPFVLDQKILVEQ